MTDTEKQTMNERIAVLAEQAGVPATLVWQAAATCPQGHDNRDYECGGLNQRIGESCFTCRRKARINMDTYIQHFEDPAWHPEWRIGRSPSDLTDANVLFAVLNAYCAITGYGWYLQQFFYPSDGVDAMIYAGMVQEWRGHADHGHAMEALAQALMKTLEAAGEKGDQQ